MSAASEQPLRARNVVGPRTQPVLVACRPATTGFGRRDATIGIHGADERYHELRLPTRPSVRGPYPHRRGRGDVGLASESADAVSRDRQEEDQTMTFLSLGPIQRLAPLAPLVLRVIVGVTMIAHGFHYGPMEFGLLAQQAFGLPFPALIGWAVTLLLF